MSKKAINNTININLSLIYYFDNFKLFKCEVSETEKNQTHKLLSYSLNSLDCDRGLIDDIEFISPLFSVFTTKQINVAHAACC